MNNDLILQPMVVMMLLTASIWLVLFAKRIPAMRAAKLPAQTYTTPDLSLIHISEPTRLRLKSRLPSCA